MCDVYQPALEKAAGAVRYRYGSDPQLVKDFREVLARSDVGNSWIEIKRVGALKRPAGRHGRGQMPGSQQ